MADVKVNEAVLFPTKNVRDPEANCHYVGNANIAGTEYQLFGRRVGENREVDLQEGPDRVAKLTMKPNQHKKDAASKRPDYVGVVHVQDGAYEFAGWVREYNSQWGGKQKLLSMRVSKKESQHQEAAAATDEGDDPPF